MKFIMEYINCVKGGWYSGKGFKSSRQKRYNEAIDYYELALNCSDNDFNPVVYDSMAIALYNMNRMEEALLAAQKSIEQYSTIKDENKDAAQRISALEELALYIKNNKSDVPEN